MWARGTARTGHRPCCSVEKQTQGDKCCVVCPEEARVRKQRLGWWWSAPREGIRGAPAGGQTMVMGSPCAWTEDTLNCALEMVFSKAV